MQNLKIHSTQHSAVPRLIGSKKFIAEIEGLAYRIKRSTGTILFTGETGTGKSLIAKYFYDRSEIYKRTLKVIPLSEIPEELFESQLFGHCKGSFTGAYNDFEGKIKAADGGNIILEDISCLPLHLQAKLLRLIQEKEFERIGETKTISVNLHIIVTTNDPLIELVKEGKFRQDLYYRLNVIEINLLPLRKRTEDIEELSKYFLGLVSSEQDKGISKISDEAMQHLKEYQWPGNIRELQAEIDRTVSLAEPTKKVLEPIDFSMKVQLNSKDQNLYPESLKEEMKQIEKEKIRDALILFNGNKVKAAEYLEISRRTLYNKLAEFHFKIFICFFSFLLRFLINPYLNISPLH